MPGPLYPPKKKKNWGLRIFAGFAAAIGLGGTGIGGASWWYYQKLSEELPDVDQLDNLRQAEITNVYASDGKTLLGSKAEEKRTPIDIKTLPPHVINAFLAAED